MKKMLIVDEDAGARQLMAVRLELLGWVALQAGTSAEASAALAAHSPEWVVTEWSVRGLEGADLMSLLEPQKRAVTLFTQREEMDTAPFVKRTGVKGWVPKSRRSELLELAKVYYESGFPAGSQGGKQVLLIEDSPLVRGFVRKAIEQNFPGCVVREVPEGRSAMSAMSQKKVDLIFSDLEMPGMDGPTFLRHIRSNPVLKTKPIIVLSSSITPELRAEFKDDAKMVFLVKPSNPSEIAQAARGFLAN